MYSLNCPRWIFMAKMVVLMIAIFSQFSHCTSNSEGTTIVYGSAPIFRATNSSSVFLSRPVDTCMLPVHSTLQYVLVTTQEGSGAWIELGENCLISYNGDPPFLSDECGMLALSVDLYDDPDLTIIMKIFNITVDDEFLNLKPKGESSIRVMFHFSVNNDSENIAANIHFISEETPTLVEHQTIPMPSPTVAPKLCPCSKLPDATLDTQVQSNTSASVHLSTCTWLLSLTLITSVIFVFR